MNLTRIHKVHFIGIGGVGMSALARFFKAKGKVVSGYDRMETKLTLQLEKEGFHVSYTPNPTAVEDADLVVFTPAIPSSHPEIVRTMELDKPLFKRAEILGEISELYPTIAIGGTHGKTTVTSMLAHLFAHASVPINAFIGGISSNYNTNIILSDNPRWQVMEADEFDRSFLRLKPTATLITSADPDHLDIYKTEDNIKSAFTSFSRSAREVAFFKHELKDELPNLKGISYSVNSRKADFYGCDIETEAGFYTFTLQTPKETIVKLKVGLPGRHNVENAVAAAAVYLTSGGNQVTLREGLSSYKGVARRFDRWEFPNGRIYIDDYAHHPSEIEGLLRSVIELYPGKKILSIFQPHLFSRTKDFLNEFATTLSQSDEVILLDIYPAREEPIPGVNSKALLEKITSSKKQLCSFDNAIKEAKRSDAPVVLTIGAGTIDRIVEPLKKAFHEQ